MVSIGYFLYVQGLCVKVKYYKKNNSNKAFSHKVRSTKWIFFYQRSTTLTNQQSNTHNVLIPKIDHLSQKISTKDLANNFPWYLSTSLTIKPAPIWSILLINASTCHLRKCPNHLKSSLNILSNVMSFSLIPFHTSTDIIRFNSNHLTISDSLDAFFYLSF